MRSLALAALLQCLTLPPASGASLSLGPSSRLWLEGDSTLHPYSSTATVLSLSARVEDSTGPAQGLAEAARAGFFKELALEVPVAGLKSGKSGLDKNMHSALKAKEHPAIRFALDRYVLSDDRVRAFGRLSAAGGEKDVVLDGALRASGDSLTVKGKAELKMSDFGIKPPTMFLGALKTDDRVVVNYELEIRRTQ